MATPIAKVYVEEGPLFPVQLEDTIGLTFHCSVHVVLPDGREFMHPVIFRGMGSYNDEEYCGNCVLPSKERATKFAARVQAAGEINLELWEAVDRSNELSLEERFELYAEEDAAERAGRPMTPYAV